MSRERENRPQPCLPPAGPQPGEERLRALFAAMGEGFALHEIICDGEGRPVDYRFLEMNAAFERQTGLAAAGLVGRTVREVLPGIEPEWIERYGRVALTGEPAIFEAHSAGLGRWYEVRAYRTAPGQFAALFMDFTERKRLQAELEQLNQGLEQRLSEQGRILESFFQHTITPLAFMTPAFDFIRVNEAYAGADGKRPDDFPGKNHFALFPDKDNQAIFERVVRQKKPHFASAKPFEYAHAPERGVTWWNWRLTPLLDDLGEVQYLVLNLEDVTARELAFAQLRRRARQLQRLALELTEAEDRERKRLSALLHDDLQQQLAAVRYQVGGLARRVAADADLAELFRQLDRSLEATVVTTRSLSHELSPSVLYHRGLGEGLVHLARQLATRHGLEVRLDVRGDLGSPAEPTALFLYRTAQEVLFNVAKHAGVREAKLRLRRHGDRLWLLISDRGRGFDPARLATGGGLGLVSIRERSEALGGSLRVRSAPGRGSTFLVSVPASARPAHVPAAGNENGA